MLKKIIPLCIFALLIGDFGSIQPLFANDPDIQATLQRMEQLLQQQQQELEAQSKELAAQRALIKQLQQAQGATETQVPEQLVQHEEPQAPPVVESSPDEALADVAEDGVDEETDWLYDPSNTIYDKNFPGAWQLPGTSSAMRVGGYVNLAIVNSFDPLVITDRFITGSIPPEGQDVLGAKAGTEVTANQTRVNLEVRQQTSHGPLRAFIEGDFEGSGDTFRLRHAFGQFRWALAGKTWTTLMDVDSGPEQVDFEGINGQILGRQSQIRIFPSFGQNMSFRMALENPQTDVVNGNGVRGHSDLVVSMNRLPLGHLGSWDIGTWNSRVGFILRDLQAQNIEVDGGEPSDNIPTDSATGWGVTTSGRTPLTWWSEDDFFVWQLTYGKGIGRYINDLGTIGGGDAVFDPKGELHALPVFAGYFSYQHRWAKQLWFMDKWPGQLRSNFTFSWVGIENFKFQEGNNYNRTFRASANLIYQPVQKLRFGMELLWGERKNKDNSKGTATQLQFSARYDF